MHSKEIYYMNMYIMKKSCSEIHGMAFTLLRLEAEKEAEAETGAETDWVSGGAPVRHLYLYQKRGRSVRNFPI